MARNLWKFSRYIMCILLLMAAKIEDFNYVKSVRSDKEMRERFYGNRIVEVSNNSTPSSQGEGEGGSIAKMIDHVLEKEFSENDQPLGADGSSFNNSVADKQAELETVAKITHEKVKKNDTGEANGTKAFQIQDVFTLDSEESDDMATLIDKKDNVFVMSNKKSQYPILQVDFRLISDLVLLIVSAAFGGIIFSCLGQPVIVGYLLAGSMVGPGGLKCISEMVQVETVAQFGVVFLLFALGLEFSMTKLRAVGHVAVLGGLLQIVVFMFLCGITAMICGGKLSEGIFVGSFLSMSSTAVVVKFLIERNYHNALHGQVAIGVLILQDCAVGLLFALLPVIGGNSGLLKGFFSMGRLLVILSLYLTAASILTWSFIPRFLKLMIQLSSQTNELYQLALVAFCLLSAWSKEDRDTVIQNGPDTMGGKPVLLKRWTSNFNLNDELRVAPLWVRFPGLPVIYWGVRTLSRIASTVGVPLFADDYTSKQSRVSFARVLIEVDITKPLPNTVKFANEKGIVVEQQVTFDWVPSFCSKCQKVGHDCLRQKRKPKVVQKWVVKKFPPTSTQVTSQNTISVDNSDYVVSAPEDRPIKNKNPTSSVTFTKSVDPKGMTDPGVSHSFDAHTDMITSMPCFTPVSISFNALDDNGCGRM